MGFTSQDDLLTQITAGKYLRREGSKLTTPVHTAGGWHLLAGLTGYPNATTFPSAQDLVFQSCNDSYGDAISASLFGIQHGGDMTSPATKHLVNMGALMVAAAGAPWQAKLVDVCGYYRLSGTNVTGTSSRTLLNSNTITFSSSSGLLGTYTNDFNNLTKVRFTVAGGSLPTGLSLATDYWTIRQNATTCKFATSYANAKAGTAIAWTDNGSGTITMMTYNPRYTNGVGCQAAFVVQTAPTGGGPNLTASAYDNTTDTAGAGTRAFQGSPTNGAAADAYAARIIHSGNAAGRFGPFLPLQGGDLGIARVNSFTFSGGTAYTGSGVLALVIFRPIHDITIPVTGFRAERDFINQLPAAPKIVDGACLSWLLFSTGATTNNSPFTFDLDFAWGG